MSRDSVARWFLLLFVAALFCFSGPSIVAHELWLERQADGYVLHYGHLHPSANDESPIGVDRTKIVDGRCVTMTGLRPLLFSGSTEGAAFAHGECDSVLLEYRGGYYTKTVNGTLPLPRNQTTYPLRSWISFEYLKTLMRWNDATRIPAGLRLELTPLADPSRWRIGEKITLLVTSGGTPVPGVPVALFEDPRGVTDSQGRINIRIRNRGIQIFQATRVVPLRRVDADEEIHTALLQLEAQP